MGKHTQGPWILGTYDHASYNVTGPKGEMPFIAKIPAGRKESERLANAFLIASAPDLLAALEDCVTYAKLYWSDHQGTAGGDVANTRIIAANAAINKAKGA